MIEIYKRHILDIICKNIGIIVCMFLLMTTSAVVVASVYDKQEESETKAEEYEENYGKKVHYWTSESLTDQEFLAYSSGGQAKTWYKKLTKLKEGLYKDASFSFYTSYSQPIYLKEKVPDIFLDGYEDGDFSCSIQKINHQVLYFAKALLVSEKFFEANKILLADGRAFLASDYIYEKGKKVPVLLGSAYKGIYKIGDVIAAEYLFEGMELQVAGFLKEKNFYLSSQNNAFVSLERYILLPAFQIEDRTEFSSLLSLMELNGGVEAEMGIDKVESIVSKHIEAASLCWAIGVHNPEAAGETSVVNKYSKMTKQVERQFKLLLALVMIFSNIGILLNLSSILEKNKYIFGIELLCGASYKDVIIEAIGLIGSIVVFADCVSCMILSGTSYGWKSYVVVQVIMLQIGVFAACYACYLIKRMQLAEITGGYE